jgi:transcription termination factor NusB
VATGRNRASGSGRTGRPRPARPPAGGRKASARELALRVIRRVTEEGAYSNLALAAELRRSSLPPRDRAFAADLVRGTLRRLLPLDRAIASASSRPLAAVDPPALALLRLGAYQLLEAGVAPHAAVGETVALASGRHRGFVNAVLRGLADHPPEPASDDDDDAVSLRTGLSPWAVGELRRLLPPEEVEPAAHALGSPASLSLRVNRCRTEPGRVMAALRDAGLEPAPGRLHPDAVLVAGGVVAEFPGFAHGWFAVQDQASMLVAAAAGFARAIVCWTPARARGERRHIWPAWPSRAGWWWPRTSIPPGPPSCPGQPVAWGCRSECSLKMPVARRSRPGSMSRWSTLPARAWGRPGAGPSSCGVRRRRTWRTSLASRWPS